MTVAPVVVGTVQTKTLNTFKLEGVYSNILPEDIWVVLDEPPGNLTLPCLRCDEFIVDKWDELNLHCPTCNGKRALTLVYIAEDHKASYIRQDGRWVLNKAPYQTINWVATEAKPYPVVNSYSLLAPTETVTLTDHYEIFGPDGERFTDDPWAKDLEVGKTVLHLSNLQPIDPPITECRVFSDEHDEYQGGAHPCCKCRSCGGMYLPLKAPSEVVLQMDIL